MRIETSHPFVVHHAPIVLGLTVPPPVLTIEDLRREEKQERRGGRESERVEERESRMGKARDEKRERRERRERITSSSVELIPEVFIKRCILREYHG